MKTEELIMTELLKEEVNILNRTIDVMCECFEELGIDCFDEEHSDSMGNTNKEHWKELFTKKKVKYIQNSNGIKLVCFQERVNKNECH